MIIHNGEKPHKYNECEQEFSQHANTRVHQRFHTVEKLCAIILCSKVYSGHLLDNIRAARLEENLYWCKYHGEALSDHSSVFTMNKSTPQKNSIDVMNMNKYLANLYIHKTAHVGEKEAPYM